MWPQAKFAKDQPWSSMMAMVPYSAYCTPLKGAPKRQQPAQVTTGTLVHGCNANAAMAQQTHALAKKKPSS